MVDLIWRLYFGPIVKNHITINMFNLWNWKLYSFKNSSLMCFNSNLLRGSNKSVLTVNSTIFGKWFFHFVMPLLFSGAMGLKTEPVTVKMILFDFWMPRVQSVSHNFENFRFFITVYSKIWSYLSTLATAMNIYKEKIFWWFCSKTCFKSQGSVPIRMKKQVFSYGLEHFKDSSANGHDISMYNSSKSESATSAITSGVCVTTGVDLRS